MELPNRKRLRLVGYDYASPNYYFVTICTHQKRCIFGEPNRLNEWGKLAESELLDIPNHYDGVTIDTYVIMPNHVHAIVVLERNGAERSRPFPTLSTIIGLYKSGVSRQIRALSPGTSIWQRSFYDHIIRNEKEYLDDWNYIQENPAKWQEDDLFC